MDVDESSLRIGRTVRAHLSLLPRPDVLRALGQHVIDICKQGADPDEVILLVNKMLCHVEKPGQEAVPYRTVTKASIANPSGMWLYRARSTVIAEGLSGCWAPPKPLAKANRLNRAGEQMLYLSTNAATASGEVGVLSSGKREKYSLIVYEVARDMTLSRIGSPPFPPRLDDETKAKLEAAMNAMGREMEKQQPANPNELEKVKVLSGFLSEMFSGPESWYPVSQHLCRFFFPLPNGFDGWLYPSVQKGWEDQNVCLLDENARSKLNVLEVLTLETRPGKEPRLKFARRPDGDGLVRIDRSNTASKALGGDRSWGFWTETGIDYVEFGEIQWPYQNA